MPTPRLGEPFHLTPLCDQEVVNEKVNLGLGKLALYMPLSETMHPRDQKGRLLRGQSLLEMKPQKS